ncbi:MAG: DEAD/DEAH box helicase [Spirochaetales bacterium]|jgi:ATP-dependent RNA helicase DeaD|nr:DEAD/DEAH box helicase [Spirochaetales bacterium]
MNQFEELGLSAVSLEALKVKGFEEPTEIQAKIIPLVLNGDKDIIGQAQTGTGKTAAFGLPILDRLEVKQKNKTVKALILAPTRELAVQVAEELNSLRGERKIAILPVYGGQFIGHQISRIREGVDIVVGTPGRIIDHLERKTLNFADLSFLVLDEADEMLNMGFIDEVKQILESAGESRRMLLFSATMPDPIRKVAEAYMGEYEMVRIEKNTQTVSLTDQIYFEVHEQDKFEALCRIIDMEEIFYGLVFCRTKIGVDELVHKLSERSYAVEGLHGDMSQAQRELILGRFRKRRLTVLVATDVAARGIDITGLSHVINFSLPQDTESYIHRIGRTGRAGSEGTAITFVTPSEYRKLMNLKRVTKADIRREDVPGVDAIIAVKKERLVKAIQDFSGSGEEYRTMAKRLLEGRDAEEALASVLTYAFQGALDTSKYTAIREVKKKDSVDRTGKSRINIRLGRKDGATKRLLADMIEQEAGVASRDIQNIEIFDTYSFLTVPFHAAEKIVKIFRSQTKGKTPLVKILSDRGGNRDRPEKGGPGKDRPGKSGKKRPAGKKPPRKPGERKDRRKK